MVKQTTISKQIFKPPLLGQHPIEFCLVQFPEMESQLVSNFVRINA